MLIWCGRTTLFSQGQAPLPSDYGWYGSHLFYLNKRVILNVISMEFNTRNFSENVLVQMPKQSHHDYLIYPFSKYHNNTPILYASHSLNLKAEDYE